MTRFNDGPAEGKVLMLKRSARFLRVVHNGKEFDALDQPGDAPRPEEQVWAYEITGKPGMAFVDGAKCRGCYPIANYSMVRNPPADEVMRGESAWHQWCVKRAAKQPREDLV